MPSPQRTCKLAVQPFDSAPTTVGILNSSAMRPLNLALIDNYDSYTHNLAHLLASANQNVLPTTILADAYSSLHLLLSAYQTPFDAFVLSPGPGNPTKTHDFSPLQRQILSSNFPVFAVCLGHQAFCHLYGATIQTLPSIPAHGVVSTISLTPAAQNDPIFASVPPTFSAVRYHSLIAVPPKLNFKLIQTAHTVHPAMAHIPRSTNQTVLMAVSHPSRPHFGVQFHPESVSSHYGHTMMTNFVNLTARLKTAVSPHPKISLPRDCSKRLDDPPLYTTHVKVLSNSGLTQSPQLLFEKLFSNQPAPFWLDSSTACGSCINAFETSATFGDRPHANGWIQHKSRFSIMGACNGPLSELVTYDVNKRMVSVTAAKNIRNRSSHHSDYQISIFDYLQKQLHLRKATVPPELPCQMNGGYIGYLGYELKSGLQGMPGNRQKSSLPDAWLVFADRLMVLDHLQKRIYLVALVRKSAKSQKTAAYEWFSQITYQLTHLTSVSHAASETNGSAATIVSTKTNPIRPLSFLPQRRRSEYIADIRKCLQAIEDGDTYEICLTNRLQVKLSDGHELNRLDFYCSLREINRAPYSAYLQLSESDAVCCTSPEKFLSIDCSGKVESKPIKGTRPRGCSPEVDEQLRSELQYSAKDRSENLMIVDLVRNDLSRNCCVGSVCVPKLMCVESFATVHQLVSTVNGILSPEHDAIDCVRGAFPMGSMTGAPKIRTMQIIDGLEHSPRGVYSGTIGYFAVSGAVDLNVVIRTAVIQGSSVTIGVGGAIVAMSDPLEEYDEMILKGNAIMQAVALNVTGQRNAFCVEHDY